LKVLGVTSYNNLFDVPETIQVEDTFRPSSYCFHRRGYNPTKSWNRISQGYLDAISIISEEVAQQAKELGFIIIRGRCIRKEHKLLSKENTRQQKIIDKIPDPSTV
jgi:predicted CoA-binding protein